MDANLLKKLVEPKDGALEFILLRYHFSCQSPSGMTHGMNNWIYYWCVVCNLFYHWYICSFPTPKIITFLFWNVVLTLSNILVQKSDVLKYKFEYLGSVLIDIFPHLVETARMSNELNKFLSFSQYSDPDDPTLLILSSTKLAARYALDFAPCRKILFHAGLVDC